MILYKNYKLKINNIIDFYLIKKIQVELFFIKMMEYIVIHEIKNNKNNKIT